MKSFRSAMSRNQGGIAALVILMPFVLQFITQWVGEEMKNRGKILQQAIIMAEDLFPGPKKGKKKKEWVVSSSMIM